MAKNKPIITAKIEADNRNYRGLRINRMKTRRTEIKIETHSITIIRAGDKQFSAFCERCQTTVAVFAIEQLAVIFRLSLAEVCRRVERDELHLIETGRGIALVCGSSLNN